MCLRAQPITVSEEMLEECDVELPFKTESQKIVFCCLLV